jgi:putative sigma-54 modulation protein
MNKGGHGMNIEIKGAHNYHVSEKTGEYLDKKITRLKHTEEMIQDFHLSVEREHNGEYKVGVDIHFRWGTMHHISATDRDLFKAIDTLFDKVDNKVTKEKERIQDHQAVKPTE